MVTRAVLRYIRITPRKFRQIIPLVKGRKAEDALALLYSVKKGASKHAIELLKSAIANAGRMQGIDVSRLYVSRLVADNGPILKRFRAASMGRASEIRKHTSHITIELDVLPETVSETGVADSGAKHSKKTGLSIKDKIRSKIKKQKAPESKEHNEHGAEHARKSKTKEPVKTDSGKKHKE